MTREKFIKKWLGNRNYTYNDQCKEEMRANLDMVIEYAQCALPPVMLPCPFCGSNDLHLHETYSGDKTITWYHLHHGPTTECSVTLLHSDKQKLFEMWNERA